MKSPAAHKRWFWHMFSFRLNLWYSGIFIVSVAAIFSLLYALMSLTIERKEQEVLSVRCKEFASIYQTAGIGGLERYVARQRESLGQQFFVRIITPYNKIILVAVPADWVQEKIERVDIFGRVREVPYVRVPRDAEKDYTLAGIALFDGSVLQVGRSANSREILLKPVRSLLFGVLAPIVILGFIGGGILAHRALLPVRQVVTAAKSIIDTGKLDARVPVAATNDEFEELARLFNTVLDRNQSLITNMRDSLDNVAHDLRTPLTRLRGIAEMGLKSAEPATQEVLAECIEESDRVLTMLRTLLDVSEAEAGVMKLDRAPADVSKLLEEACELYEFVAEEKKIEIHKEFHSDCRAELDAVRMRQVFANLLDNAIKYTSPGGKVMVRCFRAAQKIRIEFEDTGMGIPPDEIERIWDRLFRGDRSRSQKGLGLGLSLVRAIVRSHGGEVSVRSEVGRGSTFSVELPTDLA